MKVRRASPNEAEILWKIRNLAIRRGCAEVYDAAIVTAWTPDAMPASFISVISANPFFVVDGVEGSPVATGFLDLASNSVEAIFTLPHYTGKGLASLIINAIKVEAKKRHLSHLTLSSTPNAVSFYEQHGFVAVQEGHYYSRLAQAHLTCTDMVIKLSR